MDQHHQDNQQSKRPADTIRDGNIKATIWENQGEKGPYYSTVLAKTYEDRDGNLRDTHSFSGTDLLKVSELARDAYGRINELRREHSQEQAQQQGNGRDDFKQSRSSNGGGGHLRSPVPRRVVKDFADQGFPTL